MKNMRLMIDTNIFIDVLIQREPFYHSSKLVLDLCENKKVQGFLSASAVTDIYYLVRKSVHDNNIAYDALGSVLDIVKILPITNEDILKAYMQRASDFEDCLLATCAIANSCDAIVTRNKKDFQTFDIAIQSPEELIDIVADFSDEES